MAVPLVDPIYEYAVHFLLHWLGYGPYAPYSHKIDDPSTQVP